MRRHAVVSEGDTQAASLADVALTVPLAPPLLAPLVSIIPMQFLAYHVADLKDRRRSAAEPGEERDGRVGARDDPGGGRTAIEFSRPRRGVPRLLLGRARGQEPPPLRRARADGHSSAGASRPSRRSRRSTGRPPSKVRWVAAERPASTLQFLGAVPPTPAWSGRGGRSRRRRRVAPLALEVRRRGRFPERAPPTRRVGGISGNVAALAAPSSGTSAPPRARSASRRRRAPLLAPPHPRPRPRRARRGARWRARGGGPGRRGDVARRRGSCCSVAPLAEGAALRGARARAAGRRLMGPRLARTLRGLPRPGRADLEADPPPRAAAGSMQSPRPPASPLASSSLRRAADPGAQFPVLAASTTAGARSGSW